MNIPVALLLPVFLFAAFFLAIARLTVYRTHYELPQVIQFARKLNVVELSALLNPEEEWALRNINEPAEFRKIQRERIRLAFEYLRRLEHNASVVQTWAVDLREELEKKRPEDLTLQDRLICELVDISTELRIYSLVATIKVAAWVVFRVHLLPMSHVPRIADLRVIGELDVVKKYRALIEATALLSEAYGRHYPKQILNALS